MVANRGSGWNWIETAADGAFVIDGLLEREYTVHAMDPTTLLRVAIPAVAAGTAGMRIELEGRGVYAQLRGRVVDAHGEPLAGVSVAPMCDAFRTRIGADGPVVSTRHHALEPVRTDDDGRFELTDVPRDLAYLRFDSDRTIPLEWGRAEGGLWSLVQAETETLTITLGRRCRFTVQLRDPAFADSIRVLDREGHPMVLSEFVGRGRHEAERHSIHDGKTNPLSVSDVAATLVLMQGDREVQRVPLRLSPGDVQVIEI